MFALANQAKYWLDLKAALKASGASARGVAVADGEINRVAAAIPDDWQKVA